MGMRPDKAGGVEMYCAKHYLEFRDYWGTGGVLLHEFCHAYHFKHCKDGFNNEEVKEVTTVLMTLRIPALFLSCSHLHNHSAPLRHILIMLFVCHFALGI